LLPGVSLAELPHIVPDEREYFASEMMAFLVAFLISLPCPVINTPSPLSLVGPRLLHEQWLARAIAAGMTVRPWRRGASAAVGGCQVVAQHPTSDSGEHDGSGVRTYSLVGRRCFAEPDTETPSPAIVDQLRRLAAAVGVQVMTAQFVRQDRELCFVGATTTVDVSIPAVADAILEIVDPPS
jgi:hypothetical protein